MRLQTTKNISSRLENADEVNCGNSYSHLDLFHWRHTQQHEFTPLIGSPDKLKEFGRAQIDLTRVVIETLEPKVVVIANAAAAKYAVACMPTGVRPRLAHAMHASRLYSHPIFSCRDAVGPASDGYFLTDQARSRSSRLPASARRTWCSTPRLCLKQLRVKVP